MPIDFRAGFQFASVGSGPAIPFSSSIVSICSPRLCRIPAREAATAGRGQAIEQADAGRR